MGLARQVNELHLASLECNDYRAFLELPDQLRREGGAPLPGGDATPCEIAFDHVQFSYAGSERPTLQDLSFQVRPGEKIALVGLNGAGKTTCMKLLCGLYQPSAGEIRVNGVKSTEFNRDDYFKLFTAVFQDVNFLPVSVAQNVALCVAEEMDEAKVAHCVSQAGLSARIEQLPDGLHTMMDKQIYENAADFSGGERQRLLLAVRCIRMRRSSSSTSRPPALDPDCGERDLSQIQRDDQGAHLLLHLPPAFEHPLLRPDFIFRGRANCGGRHA